MANAAVLGTGDARVSDLASHAAVALAPLSIVAVAVMADLR